MTKPTSLFELAFNKSLQPSIISNTSNNSIIAVNTAACRLLGYSKSELLRKKLNSIFKKKELHFTKYYNDIADKGKAFGDLCVIKKDGRIFTCAITSSFFVDHDSAQKCITTLSDRSSNVRLQHQKDIINTNKVVKDKAAVKTKQLVIDKANKKTVSENIILAKDKSDKQFQLIFNSSSDILYDIDLITNKIILSDAFVKEFGYSLKSNMTTVQEWANHIHPDEKEAVIADFMQVLETDATEWKYQYRYIKKNKEVAEVISSAILLRTQDGKAYRMLGSMHDVSRQQVLEDQLERVLKLKEKQITDAMREAQESTRSELGKELHDNVNQLLGVSRLYLSMAKKGGNDGAMYLNRSSEYTMTAIEAIRKLSKDLTSDTIGVLGLGDAIEKIAKDTMETSGLIITCRISPLVEVADEKFKLNIFRIIQEQLNNILKHAAATKVSITISQTKSAISLKISDNGKGFNTFVKHHGIGVDNIKSRATTHYGVAQFVSQPGHGCKLTVAFAR